MPRRNDYGLGQAIRDRCAEEDIGMQPKALELGLSKNMLIRWNNGTEPGAEYYGLLMDFLGVTLEELGELILVDQLTRAGLPRP